MLVASAPLAYARSTVTVPRRADVKSDENTVGNGPPCRLAAQNRINREA